MPTAFGQPANNIVAVLGGSGYTAGSGALVLQGGQGALFPALASGWFYRITVVQQAHAYDPLMTTANYTILKATGLAGDTFSGVVAIEGTTDRNYVGGDVVDVRTTAGTLSDIQVAVNVVERLHAPICQGRLTLTSGTPVTTSDVTAATTIYWTPFNGSVVGLYTAGSWSAVSFTEKSVAIPSTASTPFDVFAWNNAGVLALETLSWTNATTRATGLTTQDGVSVKSGDPTRRYLGTGQTTATSGQCEDSLKRRFVWNLQNPVDRTLRVTDATGSWGYASTTVRQANANPANKIEIVVGLPRNLINVTIGVIVGSPATGVGQVAISEDSITVASPNMLGPYGIINATLFQGYQLMVVPIVGYHYFAWLEWISGSGSCTFFGGPSTGLLAAWRA